MSATPSEQEFIRRFNDMRTPEQLADLLRNPTPVEEQTLRTYLGPDRFRRLYILAQGVGPSRGTRSFEGNVVVLPGIMGSELTVADTSQKQTLVWFSMPRVYTGWLAQLRLDGDGKNSFDPNYSAFATNIMIKYYGEMVLRLSRRWKARAFWYDWRRGLPRNAADLEHFLRNDEFEDQPVTVVAHSLGGLVARTLLLSDPKTNSGEPLVRRIVLLGTPNYGSFETPQIFAGIQDTVRQLIKLTGGITGLFNSRQARQKLLEILDSFPGVYHMLPWPEKVTVNPDAAEQLYDANTYMSFNPKVSPEHLQSAREHHKLLNTAPLAKDRMVYVAGYGQATAVGLTNTDDLSDAKSYLISEEGDGRVPHSLGILPNVPVYYVRCAHGDLACNEEVLGAIDELVEEGRTSRLPDQLPEERGLTADQAEDLNRQWAQRFGEKEQASEDAEIAELLRRFDRRLTMSRGAGGATDATPDDVGSEERELEERVLAPFLGSTAIVQAIPSSTAPRIVVRLIQGDIAHCHETGGTDLPIDAIAGGVYIGVRPCGGVYDLDASVSASLPMSELLPSSATNTPLDAIAGARSSVPVERLFLTQLIQRGTIRGDLGVPFLLPDPRSGRSAGDVIALAGLGTPGRCGVPELALTVRELCWALNGLGRRHLATLLIGAGEGNLSVPDAVLGFLRGLARALGSMKTANSPGVTRSLERVTLVEYDGRRLLSIAQSLESCGKQLREDGQLDIDFKLTEADRLDYRTREIEFKKHRLQRKLAELDLPEEHDTDPSPARLSFSITDGAYVFGAVTSDASIPERTVEVNTDLINQTNDLLVQAETIQKQSQYGEVLGRLLIPNDLRDQFQPNAPLVMQMDARSARIHWEMVVPAGGERNLQDLGACPFLGLERGFTRQLRTTFAPPPEPPPAARRLLRVLVVADPAPDARLQGALREAGEVAELFQTFNRVYHNEVSIEVERMFGPCEANWIDVLVRLFLDRTFDVLHFAGHCFFDAKAPASSGWVFRAKPRQVLSARELRRIENLPRFVFSNACESGVTPERPQGRDPALAPSFAEAFFERGVANFICTAWPVDDVAARVFACRLYAGLLGLELDSSKTDLDITGASTPLPLHEAMRKARAAAFKLPSGVHTWGAYQHYGNPHARFFSSEITSHVYAHFDPTKRDAEQQPAPGETQSADPTTGDNRFAPVHAIIAAHGDSLRVPGVVDIRPGFEYKDGWSTGRPAVVVVVQQKKPLAEVPTAERLPDTLDGVPVDVAPATPLDQLGAAERSLIPAVPEAEQLLRPGEQLEPYQEVAERRLPYKPPADARLDEVQDAMTVTCHVSPDQGWPTLDAFLGETEQHLTVAMYDFTAPHIATRVQEILKPAGHDLTLVLDPGFTLTAGGEDGGNPKANDITEDEVRDDLRAALRKRFKFVWAAVKHKGKTIDSIFPTSYHIKVAVRDSSSLWLSSGNWQSSNQPSDKTLEQLDISWDDPRSVLTACNREWHIVLEHEELAATFEKFVANDFSEAEPLQDTFGERALPEALPDLLVSHPEVELAERGFGELRRFDNKKFVFRPANKLRVQPLLTPDNFANHVLPLIENAKRSIYFQNQYINLSKRPDPKFVKLIDALKKKVNDAGFDVRIILRDLPKTRDMLEALESEGFDMKRIRIQKSTHTKGIIVDDEAVVVGSHNWSSYGTTLNRDASLIFFNPDITAYFKEVFLHDWNGLARSKVYGEHRMPRVVSASRNAGSIPNGWAKVPWAAVFED